MLKIGAGANEFWERLGADPPSSQNAVRLGCRLFDNPSAPLADILTPAALRTMQDRENLIDFRLWPAPAPAGHDKSALKRPDPPFSP